MHEKRIIRQVLNDCLNLHLSPLVPAGATGAINVHSRQSAHGQFPSL